MKQHERKSDRLAELMGDVDPTLLAEALNTDTPEALAALAERRIPVVTPKSHILTKGRMHALVASAAVVVALALVLPLTLRLAGGIPDPWGSENPGETSAPDPYVDPDSIIPPWVSGSLKLSSLTYKGSTDTAAAPYPSMSLLSNFTEEDSETEGDTSVETNEITEAESDTDAETERKPQAVDPIYGLGENYTVSILPNMKITDYLEGGLIKLRPDDGEHTHCPDVYYDIQGDAYICLSCRIGELLTGSEEYAQAALDCLIEECFLSYTPLMASGMNDSYEDKYRFALSRVGLKEKLAQRGKITKTALGDLDYYNEGHEDHVAEQIKNFEYPVVDVVEYGADLNRCMVTLTSPRTGMGYGNFLCDLTAGTLISLDSGMDADKIPNLSLATSVIITEDYRTAVITVPYFATSLSQDRETGLLIPQYTRSNIFLYDLESMACTSLADGAEGYAPVSEGVESMGVITYKGTDGVFYAYYRGVHFALPSAPLRICRDRDGTRYAIIANGDGYGFYRLSEDAGKPMLFPDAMEGKLDSANRYLTVGNLRVDLISGERVILWEGEPMTQVVSRDGRYIYLYFEGDTDILCVDVWSDLKGRVSLSETFLDEALAAGEVTYRLLLSHGGDRLLMTYFEQSTVAFDAESFLNVHPSERRGLVATVEDIVNHFTVNGRPLRFYEKSRAIQLAKLLFLPDYLDMIERGYEDKSEWMQLCVEVGEQMIPYLDVWANSAEVPHTVVSEKMGVLSADQLTELFRIRYGRYETYLFTEEKIPSRYGSRRDYALDGYTRAIRDVFLKYYGVTATEENTAYLDTLIHSRLDAIVSEEITYTQVELQQTLEALLVEAAPTVLGYSYGEFLQNAAFFAYHEPWWEEYRLTTDETAGDIRCSPKQFVDQDYVRSFLKNVTFTEGDVEIRAVARISCQLSSATVTLVELGYAEDGKAYVRAHGVYAEITPEDVEAFKTEAVSKQTQYEPVVID